MKPILTDTQRSRIKTPRGFLLAMARVLATPGRWTKKVNARGRTGNILSSVFDPRACKFCLSGAAMYVFDDYNNDNTGIRWEARVRAWDLLSQVIADRYMMGPVTFNDVRTTTFKDIKMVLKEAIKKARGGKA